MSFIKAFRIAMFVAILSAIFFFTTSVSFENFILVAFLSLGYLLVSYRYFCCNKNITILFASVCTPCLLVFLGFKYYEGYRPTLDDMDWLYIILSSAALLSLLFYGVVWLQNKKRKNKELINFFPARERELQQLKDLLDTSNVVGLNSYWGDGKTFLMELFAQKYKIKKFSLKKKEGYYVIPISVMSATVETIESYIVSEIDSFLDCHGVFSYSTPKIRNFFNQPLLKNWAFIFEDRDSYTALLKSLVNDVKNLGFTIILSFEDLERIKDGKILRKIFSITEQIKCEHIKIVFQYNDKLLLSILDEKDPLFLEKYIPYSINLSTIEFKDIVSGFLSNNLKRQKPLNHLLESDFQFLYDGCEFNEIFREKSGYNYHLPMPATHIRKVEWVLNEIDFLLGSDFFSQDKQLVIVFCIVKSFFPEIYSQFKINQSPLKTITFVNTRNNVKQSTSLRAYINELEIQKNIEHENPDFLENCTAITVLHQLGYTFDFLKDHGSESLKTNQKWITDRERNSQIDYTIWKLMQIGNSGISPMQNFTIKICKILSKDTDVYKKYGEIEVLVAMEGDLVLKNANTEFTKIEYITTLFDIFVKKEEDWANWIDYVLQTHIKEHITPKVILFFLRCKISHKGLLLIALRNFSTLSVKSSFNADTEFLSFLKRYLEEIKKQQYFCDTPLNCLDKVGYQPTSKNKNEDSMEIGGIEELIKMLKSIHSEVSSLKSENEKISSLSAECGIVIDFISKITELVNAPERNSNIAEDDEEKLADSNDEHPILTFETNNNYAEYMRLSDSKYLDAKLELGYEQKKLSISEIKQIRKQWNEKHSIGDKKS